MRRSIRLAAGLSTALAAVTLLAPLLWLGWSAQQEIVGAYSGLRAFLTHPSGNSTVPERYSRLGDWLAQQRLHLQGDLQGVSDALKGWPRPYDDKRPCWPEDSDDRWPGCF